MPLRSEVGSFGCKANLAMGLVHHTAKAAPIFRHDAVSVPFGHGGQKMTGETYPCCSGTSQWHMVHTHKCSAFIGIRGIQNSSNHMRDLTRTTEAGERRQ